MEYLDAVVARVGDGDHAAVAHVDALRRRELPDGRTGRAERKCRRAVGIEHPHAVAGSVSDDCHARRQGALLGGDGRHGERCQQARGGDGREQRDLYILHTDAQKL